MTLIVGTVTDTVAVLSADTFISERGGALPAFVPGPADGMEAHIAATYCGSGKRPDTPPQGFSSKVHVYPHLRMAMACAGQFWMGPAWAGIVSGALWANEILDFDAAAPRVLSRMADRVGLSMPTMVFHVGYSPRAGRMMGFCYRSEDNFRSEAWQGSMYAPVPYPEAPGYAELYERSLKAAEGEDIEQFHVLVARNIEHAHRAGKLIPWMHVGGDLISARIDERGVHLSSPYRFANHQEWARTMPLPSWETLADATAGMFVQHKAA